MFDRILNNPQSYLWKWIYHLCKLGTWSTRVFVVSIITVVVLNTGLFKYVWRFVDTGVKPQIITTWKVSKYGGISGLYFPIFSPNTGKCGPEITPYLDTFHVVNVMNTSLNYYYKVSREKKTKPWCSFPRGIFLWESSKGRWIYLNALLRVGICPVKTFPSLHLPAQI